MRLGRALAPAAFLLHVCSACTSSDPLYCDEQKPCGSGQRCNLQTHTCELTGDGSAPAGDAGRPDTRPLQPDAGPGLLENGATCSDKSRCTSGYCVDGVCCEAACDGTCRTCNAPGKPGTCVLAEKGLDPRQQCGGSDATCGGSCDGQGACSFTRTGTSCGKATCSAGQLSIGKCDGQGGCKTETQACGGYACEATGDKCKTSCADAKLDCSGTFQCVNKVCTADQPNGAVCGTNPAACKSGKCVDGVCCESACDGACQRCNAPGKAGTCSPEADGTLCGAASCSGASKSVPTCTTGKCEPKLASCGLYGCNGTTSDCRASCSGDGDCAASAYCANTQCLAKKGNGLGCAGNNQCQTGICTAVEKVCCDSACAGACDTCAGKAACSRKPQGTPCGADSCVNQAYTAYLQKQQCNGTSSACQTVVSSLCDPYRCAPGGAAACATACSDNNGCTSLLCDTYNAPNNRCIASSSICYVKPGGGGNGSHPTTPLATMNACLATGKSYLSIADGTYSENLDVSSRKVHLVAATVQPDVYNNASPTVVNSLPGSNTAPALWVHGGSAEVYVQGLRFTGGAPSDAAIYLNPGTVVMRKCTVDTTSAGGCIYGRDLGTIDLADSRLTSCYGTGITTYGGNHVKLLRTRINGSVTSAGVSFSDTVGTATFEASEIEVSDHNASGLYLDGKYGLNGTRIWVSRAKVQRNRGVGISISNAKAGLADVLSTHNSNGVSFFENQTVCSPICNTIGHGVWNLTSAHNTTNELTCGAVAAATWRISNSILASWNNAAFDNGPGCALSYTHVYNAGVSGADPQFASSADFHLLSTSPCKNAGDPGFTPPSSAVDLEGSPRKFGPAVDQGAYELQAP